MCCSPCERERVLRRCLYGRRVPGGGGWCRADQYCGPADLNTRHQTLGYHSTTGPLVYLSCQIIVNTLPTHPDLTETSLSVSVFCNWPEESWRSVDCRTRQTRLWWLETSELPAAAQSAALQPPAPASLSCTRPGLALAWLPPIISVSPLLSSLQWYISVIQLHLYIKQYNAGQPARARHSITTDEV